HPFDRVGDRDPGDDGAASCRQFRHDPAGQFRAGEGPGGVVHEDERAVVGQGAETGGDGRLPGEPAGDDPDRDRSARDRPSREELAEGVQVLGRGGDDDGVHHPRLGQAAGGVDDERGPRQRDESLGQVVAETGAGARGREDGAAAHVGQEVRTSSSIASACSSSVCSASASAETRSWRAWASSRFSPAARPRPGARRAGSRTPAATLVTSPEAIFATFALYRRDQLVGSSVYGARSTSKTFSRPSLPTTSRTPTRSTLSAGTSMVRSP